MALDPQYDYATAALDAIRTAMSPDDTDVFDDYVEPMLQGIEDMIRSMLADAEVSFSAGDLGGTDSNGDTPDNITAAGGVIT